MAKNKKGLTISEKEELYNAVEGEGFFYYMADYGPNWKLIEKMGYKRKELEQAINLLQKVNDDIYEWQDELENV